MEKFDLNFLSSSETFKSYMCGSASIALGGH